MAKRTPLTFDVERVSRSQIPTIGTGFYKNAQTDKQEKEQVHKRANTGTKGREGRQFVAAHVLPEAAKQFKLLGVQIDRTTQSLLIEAINDLFVKYGLSRIADE
jgi:hypothetical protein